MSMRLRESLDTTLVAMVFVLVALVLLAVPAGAVSPTYQTTVRASVSSAGTQGDNDGSNPGLSADGRHVAYDSLASNLVPGDTNGSYDAFVRDLASGETTRVSVSSSGEQGGGDSYCPAPSADGRYVAFYSAATNLVPDDTNSASDVFVRDLASRETTRASVSSSGEQGNGTSDYPDLSADGRYVAFQSLASNLVLDDTNGASDVFVRDLASRETTRVSVSSSGEQGNDTSLGPALSADGRYVAFISDASNLVPDDTNVARDAFVRDLASGETTRVSVSTAGTQGNNSTYDLAVSDDGRYVAFFSFASNLVFNDTNGWGDVFARDLASGETTRVSVSSAGTQSTGASAEPAISADGRYVVFTSYASNLVPGDTNGTGDAFVRDLSSVETTRVSVSSSGGQSNGNSDLPAISADGRYVAFESYSTDLVPDDTNSSRDIFVRDRMRGSALTATSASKTLSSYGAKYIFTGTLESSGAALGGKRVVLQSSATTSGFADTSITAITTAGGTFGLTATPRVKTYYRARFAGDGAEYDASVSGYVLVTPRAYVSRPIAPSVMYAGRARTVYGYLKPRHTAGTYPVRIYKYRYVSRRWRSYGYVTAKASDRSSYTKYARSMSLPYRGRWRLKAYHPADSGHAASWSSGYDYVTVR